MPFNRFSYDKTVNVKKRVGISNGKLPEILTVKKVKSICRIRLEITVVRLRKIKVLSIMLPQFAYFKMPYTDAQHYALWFRIVFGEN